MAMLNNQMVYTVYPCISRKADRASCHVNHGVNIIPIHRIHAAALSGSSPPATWSMEEASWNCRMATHSAAGFQILSKSLLFVHVCSIFVHVFHGFSWVFPYVRCICPPLCLLWYSDVVQLRCCCSTEKDKSLSTRTCGKWLGNLGHVYLRYGRGSWMIMVWRVVLIICGCWRRKKLNMNDLIFRCLVVELC